MDDDAERNAVAAGWKKHGFARPTFRTPVFLSYPKPYDSRQEEFIRCLCSYLDDRGFTGRTLGVTDYSIRAPLRAIRKLMLDCDGLIAIAFRRTFLKEAAGYYRADVDTLKHYNLSNTWLTSPWAHIEPAMAYQIGLPILILRESGVVADGVLEDGIVGLYMPQFNLDGDVANYFLSEEWKQIIREWEGDVRAVENRKGEPPKLF